jgi:hypothetical protein
MKTITIEGLKIDPQTEPNLWRIAEKNPEGLKNQLKSLAKASGATLEMAAINLENDLQHG